MLISGFPQQIVLADPGLAKGVTVTGTQMVSLWLNNDSHSFVSLHTGPQIARPVAVVPPPNRHTSTAVSYTHLTLPTIA